MPALPALLPRSSDDAVYGDHSLLDDRPVSCAVFRHEFSHGIIVVLRPWAPASFQIIAGTCTMFCAGEVFHWLGCLVILLLGQGGGGFR